MQRALLLGATALGLGLLASWGCDPIDTCDSNQFYSKGACVPCPDDAKSDGSMCVCDDEKKTFSGGTCRYREGEEPETGADGGDTTGEDTPAGESDVTSTCGSYCGLLKDCIADNSLVSGLVGDVLSAAGLAKGDPTECKATCASDGAEAANSAALACFAGQAKKATCAGNQTLDGAGEALDIIDGCCAKHGSSALCKRLCSAIALNPLAKSNVPACQ